MKRFGQVVSRAFRIGATLFPIYLSYFWLWVRGKLGFPARHATWSATHLRHAERFYRLAVRMRGGLIKIGQMISVRVDIAPIEWTQTLSRLQDKVDPTPWEAIETRLTTELGRPPDEVFAEIEHEARNAASFGQVHRAKTRDGQDVALKVKYEDIESQLAIDLALLGRAVPLFNIFIPKVRLSVIVREITAALRRELDYEKEADFTQRIHDNLRGVDGVVVPRVLPEYTTKNVICTTWFEGFKVTDKAKLEALGVDVHDLMKKITEAYTHMVFIDGLFQSDPHPGNLLFHVRDGKLEVCILDFGQVKELPAEFQQKMIRTSVAYMVRDVDGFSRGAVDLGVMSERDIQKARPMLDEFFEHYFEMSPADAKNLDFDRIGRDVKALIDKIDGVTIPQDIILYGRMFGLLAGVFTALDARTNGLILAKPIIMELLLRAPAAPVATPAAS